ncbi:MAG: Pr6Pr family membrane protein [Gemmatimonadaceae bacterium]
MNRPLLIALRLTFGVLTLVAIGIQLNIQIGNSQSIVNFFSYFTNLSNLLAAFVLLYGAYRTATQRAPTPLLDLIRTAAAINMLVVGIVFALLLRDVDLGALLPWINTQLHYVMPVFVVGEWLLVPPQTKLGIRQLVLCLLFPVAYLAYVLVRGAITNWYPYPFLNPETVGGYDQVALYALAIVGVFLAASWIAMRVSSRRSLSASTNS